MRHTILRRNAITSPQFSSLSKSCQIQLSSISSELAQHCPVSPQSILDAPDAQFYMLRHRLSEQFLALNGVQQLLVRSDQESRVLAWLEKTEFADCDQKTFNKLLEETNLRLTGGNAGWRSTKVSLNKDLRGNAILFPDISAISHQLELLRPLLQAENTIPPAFTALSALVLLTNCHPFRDANGRVGRVLFNYSLRKGGMPEKVYVPFYEIAARSHGGYQIALREGELRNKWAPLSGYVCSMLDAYKRMGTSLHDES